MKRHCKSNDLSTSKRRLRILAACVIPLALLTGGSMRAAVIEETDVTYGKAGDRQLKLDLARPEGDGPFPAIVFIHGGGWRGGHRSRYRSEISTAAARGYVAVTVTYRLTEADETGKAKHPFPAQVEDVKCAVRWLRANAARYKVDPGRIGATGESAGGHLSLMLGLTDKSAGLEGGGGEAEQSSQVQAVVNFFGPTEMIELHRSSKGAAGILAQWLAGTPEQARDRYLAASPATYVSKDDAVVLSLHGADDALVPIEQAKLLDKRMKAAGASHTLTVVEGQGHGFRGDAGQQARQAMYRFFDRHLQSKPAGQSVLFEDKFTGKLADGWSWVREDPKAWRLAGGALEIRTQPGNMWGGANNAKNLLVRQLPDSQARTIGLEVSVANRPTERWEQAGVVWYYDDSNMVKLVKELVDGKVSIVMGREKNDRTQTIAIIPLPTASVQLRLAATGTEIRGQFRPGGKGPWQEAGTCNSPGEGKARLCLQTYNGPTDAEHWVRFTGLRVVELRP